MMDGATAMSEINGLIHTNARLAYDQGIKHERERIMKLLENPFWHSIQSPDIHIDCDMCKTIELIKGEK